MNQPNSADLKELEPRKSAIRSAKKEMGRFKYDLLLFIMNVIIGTLPIKFIRMQFYKRVCDFRVSPTTVIFRNCSFDAPRGLTCGENVVINSGCRIDTRGGVSIGSNVSISQDVFILTAEHDPADPNFRTIFASATIGDNSFIGTRAMMMPGASLGEGAILGAGAVLTKAVPDYEIWAGNPARKVGNRIRTLSYEVRHDRYLQ